ncbi:MAG: ABC transporter substrate-binding protein [Actinomycetota bacterium]|nr:ABC transporter substrate-binding protein [Actinomycetota bacterium]
MDRRTFLRATMGTFGFGALAMAACATGEDEPGAAPAAPTGRPTLRLPGGLWGFPSPFAYLAGPGYTRMTFIYDTLVWKDASGQLLPWLAASHQRSEDGLVYTFHLRDGVRWHDGKPLTAEDVAFTYDYFGAQTLSFAVIAGRPEGIVAVRALDPRTVEFRLDQPRVTFLESAGSLPIVPRHIWSSIPDAARVRDLGVLVGSGPYRLEAFSQGEGSYLYTANDDYFLGRPFVERIEMRLVDDQTTAVLGGLLDAGETREVGVAPDAVAPFRSDPSFGVMSETGPLTIALYWNLARGGALADIRFRHGCARAIDRVGIVDRLLGGNGQPGNPGFLPPGHPFHVPVEQYPLDTAAAERLLDEAGFPRSGTAGIRQGPDGAPLRFELLAPGGLPPVVELVVGMLRDVGVELTVRALDQPSLLSRMTGGNYDMAMVSYGGLNADPDYLRRLYSSRAERRFFHSAQGYVNPEFDELAARQLRTFDLARRKELVARMQQIVARDLPFLHLYYPTQFHVYSATVFDQWYYTPGGIGPGVPSVYNKHAFVTGRKTGLEVGEALGSLAPAAT